jgi:hypothetical protein
VLERGGTGSALVTGAPRRAADRASAGAHRPALLAHRARRAWRPERGGDRADGLPNELTNANNRRWSRSRASARSSACCSSPANLTPAKGLGVTS